jgi:hypothetical protein
MRMLRKSLLSSLGMSICVLAVINLPASLFYWYSLLWWVDMPMHFLGGISVFYLSALVWLPAMKWVGKGRFIYESIITALLLGVLWEALELYLHMHYGTPDFVLVDSISDVFFDLSGILLAVILTIPLLEKYSLAEQTQTKSV